MSKNNGKKNVSQRQLEANRRKAQKSTGPKTQAGIDNSKFNAIKHGLTADTVCIPGEHLPHYEERRRQYHAVFQPANLVEFDLVDSLSADNWRRRRVIKHESMLVTLEFERRQEEPPQFAISSTDADGEASLATQTLANDGHALRLLDRYESRINHNIHRTLQSLLQLQRNRLPLTPHTPSILLSMNNFHQKRPKPHPPRRNPRRNPPPKPLPR